MNRKLVIILIFAVFLSPSVLAQDLIVDGGSRTLSGTQNYDQIRIINGGDLYITDNSNGGGKLTLEANSITVDSSSRIYGTARGPVGATSGNRGNGNSGGPGNDQTGANAGGGGYGGQGGCGPESGAPSCSVSGGSSYGSTTSQEIRKGSSGGAGSGSSEDGGDAGAAVLLDASDIDIHGTIEMDGQNGQASSSGSYGGGGGSGGGIMIRGADVDLSGATLSADGGEAGNSYGGSGAGGRIKIFYGTLQGSYSTSVNGPNEHTYGGNLRESGAIGEDGTVHTEQVNAPPTITNPDPSYSTSTSPVYTNSPQLAVDVNDPNGGNIDVTFYSPGGDGFTLQQGSNSWDITPYTSAEGSGSFYPGPVSGSSDFLLAAYRDTSADEESIIFGTEADSNTNTQLDLRNIPSGSTVTRTDDSGGAGNSRHSRDELSLSHEPEGDWGWGSCCTDGGALQLGSGWNDITIDPSTSVGVGPNFVFYESDGNRVNLDKNQELEITSNSLTEIGSRNSVSSGRITTEWSGLSESQSYDWYVRACDSLGACTTSSTWTFDVSGGPRKPDNPNPSDTEIVGSSGTVQLSARYRHRGGQGPGNLSFYNQDGSMIDSCMASEGGRCSVTKSVTSGQRYDWYAVAKYNGQTATSDTWYFETNTPPEKPVSPSPSDGTASINYDSRTLSAYVEDADGDNMDVTFTGNTGSDTFSKTTTVSGSGTATVNVNNLDSGSTYDWQVQVEDSHGASETSDTWSFTTNYVPSISNPQPVDGAYISSDQAELRIDVSDTDGDYADVRIYDQNNNQIGSGSTSDGSEITVTTDYTGLSFGNTYDWTVEANDSLGVNSKTISFSVIGSGSFRSATGIEYEYSSVIKSSSQTGYLTYTVSNNNVNDKQLSTSLEGPEANFQNYTEGTSYILSPGETREFSVEVTEDQPGDYTLSIVTADQRLGVENTDSIPVVVREYPASSVREVPGLAFLQLAFIVSAAFLLFNRY